MPLEKVGASRSSSAVAGAGHGKNTVRGFYRAAADVKRRAGKFINSEKFESNCGADDVDDRIHRPHFVEMDFFDSHLMHLGFRFAQARENSLGAILQREAQFRLVDQVQNRA